MKPQTSYLICSTGRTGSTLLCQMLSDTGIAGAPDEFFFYIFEAPRPPWVRWLREPHNIDLFYEQMAEYTTPNGVFGVNIMWAHFFYMMLQLRQIPVFQSLETRKLLDEAFVNPHYLWTTRRDKAAQAVSLWRAEQTGVWVAGKPWLSPLLTDTPRFSYGRIDALVSQIENQEQSWKWFFEYHDIQPLTVVYEDFAAAPEQTLRQVLEYIGVAIPAGAELPAPRLERQADRVTEEWVERYRELKQAEGGNRT